MERKYCIQLLGTLTESTEGIDIIKYDRKNWRKPHDLEIDVKKLLLSVRHCPQFEVLQVSPEPGPDVVQLGLFFCPQVTPVLGRQNQHIVDTFFTWETPQMPGFATVAGSSMSLSDFYNRLREAHQSEESDDRHIDTTFLLPRLREYQENGVRWLLKRETKKEYLPSEFVNARTKNLPEVNFFLNIRTFELTDVSVGPIEIPPGGILADEMGLGKTVEMLALILNNPLTVIPNLSIYQDGTANADEPPPQVIKCVCRKNFRDGFVQCSNCGLFQHTKCLLKNTLGRPKRHVCPDCFKADSQLLELGATIIVSPNSIKLQWLDEIKRHITDVNFKVLVYAGIKETGWVSPYDLTEYNVVLTDYEVLKSELYFTNKHEREGLRNTRRHMNLTSPLTLVKWHRVILDEAQMIESNVSNAAKMAAHLPTRFRWSVTGTPIEKSIDNLYGLIYFIDFYPLNDNCRVWKPLVAAYMMGHWEPLIDKLKMVMWRTCKSEIVDQLGIPPQQEVLHYITMSDLQKFFYRSEHAQCFSQFQEKAKKLVSTSTLLSKMDSQTLKKIMEPLRKLRQDCSVPSIFHKNDQTVTKKTLSPNELHTHMVKNRENECKSQLRSMASSLNGQAGLMIIQEKYDAAAKYYKTVLKLAKEYTGDICVDSLLQIHALNSLCELPTNVTDSELVAYRDELKRLEWKYIESYYSLADAALNQLASSIELVESNKDAIKAAYEQGGYKYRNIWYREYLYECLDNVVDRINNEIRTQYPAFVGEDLKTVDGVDYVVTMWLEKVMTTRDHIQDAFDDLSYFYDNVKPKEQLAPDVKKRIDHLIATAFKCHLDPKLKELEDEKPLDGEVCHLCALQNELNKYECVIFDKRLEVNNVKGSWNPCYQETILKYLQASAKNNNRHTLAQFGAKQIQLLDAIKKEFKDYSKFWVEINYTASAYDELNMCKYQLQLIRSIDTEKESNLQIYEYEINETFHEYQRQFHEAEQEFVRLKGSLNYLRHLKEKNDEEPEMCPICKQKPDDKYSVLQCGHQICLVCVTHMSKLYNGRIKCSVCRHQQLFKNVYFVTCNSAQNSIVLGHFSNKIIKIVETVLNLRSADPNVKIIIFSQWETILCVVAQALTVNSILFRSKSAKFHTCIDEFRDARKQITCLLMPLRFGSKGLNLTMATHVFLVEPILDPGEELQAIGRIHRIGQTRETFVHRFIVRETIEQRIYETIAGDQSENWTSKDVSVENLQQLFELHE